MTERELFWDQNEDRLDASPTSSGLPVEGAPNGDQLRDDADVEPSPPSENEVDLLDAMKQKVISCLMGEIDREEVKLPENQEESRKIMQAAWRAVYESKQKPSNWQSKFRELQPAIAQAQREARTDRSP